MLLEIEDLHVYYFTKRGVVRAVEGVSFELDRAEILGIVGESGSGKSTLGLAIMNLVPSPGKIVRGSIRLDGKDLTKMSEKELRDIRGKEIAMVFQDPMTSLDPLMRIGDQIVETILAHEDVSKEEAKRRALELLEEVGISRDRFNDYPHQLSGGMRQRVMIAMAISLSPRLIIADEPTTALDVIVQDQIMELFSKLRDEFGVAIILISHDLALELEVSDKIGVMYAGWLMELSKSEELAKKPLNPYARELLKAIPNVELEEQELVSIPGSPPDLHDPPKGCRFHPRCPDAMPICFKEEPPTKSIDGRLVKCWLYGG
ncbi:MAG: ABC transporter ATP-binding protein [Candidatus Korarchaeota archaeon]|nr:ABC transporter ATP-binding protein [Candidatus Korarchaeota archaeon]